MSKSCDNPTSHRGGRPLVETATRIHVRDIRNTFGWVAPDLVTPDGIRIRTRIEAGTVTWLHLEHHRPGSVWADAAYLVSLISSPQPFGGERWRFLDPDGFGPCSALYLPPGARRFASREAHGLAFASQRLRAPARARARAQRIREDLGGSADLAAPFPVRPRGMHVASYDRLRTATLEAQARA